MSSEDNNLIPLMNEDELMVYRRFGFDPLSEGEELAERIAARHRHNAKVAREKYLAKQKLEAQRKQEEADRQTRLDALISEDRTERNQLVDPRRVDDDEA